jgi:Mn-dependent DtxR family transcriptional regulator
MNVYSNKITELIRREEVVTSSEVARFLKVSWNTAEKCLLELALEGKIRRKKKEGTTLWMKN